MSANDALLTRGFLSYNMLKEVLATTSIQEKEEAQMVTRMKVDPRHIEEFEKLLRLILKNTHSIGHVSTCVVKPPVGELTYTSIVKYSSLSAMKQIYPSSIDSGVDFYKLLAARDSLLLEPPTYQIEAGFGTWIESDGNTKPMRGDNPDEDDNPVFNSVPGHCCQDSCENPHGLNVRASFVAPTKSFKLFQDKYQRNNKKGGQKNLRCFPSCRNGRHVTSGFCGDSVRVHVAISRITESGGVKICPIQTQQNQPAVLAYARFVNVEGVFDTAMPGPEIFPGQTIEKDDVLSFVRDKNHPMNPLIPGILRGAAMESSAQSAIFEFNSECKAWHYGWTAPRGQGLSGSDVQHVLEVLFFKPLGAYMYCLERLRSDSFSIYSSRRASNVKQETSTVELYDGGEDDDDRMLKRKRGSATSTTSSIYTVSTPVSYNTPRTPQETFEAQSSQILSSLNDGIKVEATCPPSLPPTPPTISHTPATNIHTSPTSRHQQIHGVVSPVHATPVSPSLATSVPTSQVNSFYSAASATTTAAAGASGLPPVYTNGPMSSGQLFTDVMAGSCPVVTTEEIPWSELYNLFDPNLQLAVVSSPMSDQVLMEEDGDEETTSSGQLFNYL